MRLVLERGNWFLLWDCDQVTGQKQFFIEHRSRSLLGDVSLEDAMREFTKIIEEQQP